MKKWKYEQELAHAQDVLITAYLLTMHSKAITVTFEHGDALYAHDLTEAQVRELARVAPMDCKNGFLLKTQKISKKREKLYMMDAVRVCSIAEKSAMQAKYPDYNNGTIAEFCYRRYITGEQALKVNNTAYDVDSDSKDGKQLKDLTSGATFTNVAYLLKVCRARGVLADEVETVIKQLEKIYEF